jgi:hypothetical protein
MAKLTLTDLWETSLTHEEVVDRILTFFNQFKIKIKKNTPTEIFGKQGSHFKVQSGSRVRSNPALYPKRIFIYLTGNGGTIQIEVRFEDVYYLITPGVKIKYRNYLDHLMRILKNKLPERHIAVKIPVSSKSKRVSCMNCGVQLSVENQVYCIECGKKIL